MDAEVDDCLAWVLLEHLRKATNSEFNVLVQLPARSPIAIAVVITIIAVFVIIIFHCRPSSIRWSVIILDRGCGTEFRGDKLVALL